MNQMFFSRRTLYKKTSVLWLSWREHEGTIPWPPKNGSLVIFPHTYSLVFSLHQTFLPGITWLVKGGTDMEVWIGMLIPFVGTALGAACVIFMGAGVLNARTQGALAAFAAGVMAAASVWSLLLPAISQSAALGPWAFAPATAGLGLGAAFIWALDRWLPEPQNRTENAMMILAVTLHNVPEGMAVGVAWAGVRSGITGVTAAAAMALALGIAIQNVPEGAIVALPLRAAGKSRARAFAGGTASGAVEPLAAGVTLLLSGLIAPVLPALLAFAAGAMIYVTVAELIPRAAQTHPAAPAFFVLGFSLMMGLDVALG